MNDWSARDLQRVEMAVGLGPSKGKDFATSLGRELVPFDELRDRYRDGRLHLEMTATVNGRVLSRGNAGTMYWTWPQLLAHASRDTELRPGDVLGSGTVGTGCILELTPEAVGGWLKPGDVVELTVDESGRSEVRCGKAAIVDDSPIRSDEPGCVSSGGFAQETHHAPYLRLGSIPPQAAHRAPTSARLQGRGDLLRRGRHHRGLRPGVLASSTTSARRRASRKVEPAGTWAARARRASRRCGTTTSRPARLPAGRRPDHRPRADASANDDVTLWRAAGRARPQAELYRNATADEVVFVHQGRGPAAHACSARCRSGRSTTSSIPRCTTYRFEFDPAAGSRTCSSSRRPATSASRRGI